MRELEDRLTEVEIALSHQQAALDELSAVAREQAARVDRLERALIELARRLEEARAAAGAPPEGDVRPPHW